MSRPWLLLVSAALVIALVIGALAWHRGARPPQDVAEAPDGDDDSADEPLPSRAETEGQMRAIGYVQ